MRRACVGALVCASLAAPVSAADRPLQEFTTPGTFQITATTGSCPKSVSIATRARQYEGGGEFDTTVRTAAFAGAPRRIARAPHRVEYSGAPLRPRYSSCEAAARFAENGIAFVLVLHRGTVRVVISPAPDYTIMNARVVTGNPFLRTAVAD